MAKETPALYAFNRGLVSPLALARTDIKRVALSASEMVNWMPRVLGSMMLRPGWEHLGSSQSDAAARYMPFVFSVSDTALIELTASVMRVWVDDELITRPSVSTQTTNGTFPTDLTGWTDADEVGGSSGWLSTTRTGVAGGYMGLSGDGTAAGIRTQQVTVAVADRNVEHALHIVVTFGKVSLRVGSSSGADDYVTETQLDVGSHSLAFTPTVNFHIYVFTRRKSETLIDSIVVESSGVMTVETPWSASDLDNITGGPESQSGDIIYVACEDHQQRKLTRRAARSWSCELYATEDGPFRNENVSTITLAASQLSGFATITASKPLFRSSHVGSIWRLTPQGQHISGITISAENTFCDPITVTSTGEARRFSFTINISGGNTATLQRSFDQGSTWVDVADYTVSTGSTLADGFDNVEVQYRVGIKTGNYVSANIVVSLDYSLGSIEGIFIVATFTNSTTVVVWMLHDVGSTDATEVWSEGSWSTFRGFPTAVSFVEGRLGWAGQDREYLTVSDDFESFDDSVEGDSGPIQRSIGSGPVDSIRWMLALQRLVLGGESSEFVCKSSSFDEPLTPTNCMIKACSTQGTAAVQAVKLDSDGIYIQRGGSRVMELSYNGDLAEYQSSDISLLVPDIGDPGITRIAVQRQPDTRIHCRRSDGTVGILVRDRLENVACWLNVETDGEVEDVVILPGESGQAEDRVYYHVKRTINGSTKRFLEKWALESECQGGTLNKQMDCFVTGSATTTPTVTVIEDLGHLEGEEVIVWADGIDYSPGDDDEQTTFTVASGKITVTTGVSQWVVGKAYDATWKSSKLAYAASLGSALTQKKRISHVGAILYNTHYKGLRFGRDFDHLDALPLMKNSAPVAANTIHSAYDQEAFEFPGEWSTDSRLCLKAQAPRPCTILAAVIPIETSEKY